jgi:hypothetical protein
MMLVPDGGDRRCRPRQDGSDAADAGEPGARVFGELAQRRLGALPRETVAVDIHCVTKWSKLETAGDRRPTHIQRYDGRGDDSSEEVVGREWGG